MHCVIIQLKILPSANVPSEGCVHASVLTLAPHLTVSASIRRSST